MNRLVSVLFAIRREINKSTSVVLGSMLSADERVFDEVTRKVLNGICLILGIAIAVRRVKFSS
jgi:hypothetical protein